MKHYVFLSNPKTGSSSITNMLESKWHNHNCQIYGQKDLKKNKLLHRRSLAADVYSKPGHWNLFQHKMIEIIPYYDFLNSYKICFTRNPYDKLVSLYYYSKNPKIKSFSQFVKTITSLDQTASWSERHNFEMKHGLNPGHTFSQYTYIYDIDLPSEEKYCVENAHVTSRIITQNKTIELKKIFQETHFVGKYEKFPEYVDLLFSFLESYFGTKKPTNIPRLKPAPYRPKDYRRLYNTELIDIVQEYYQDDLTFFNYKFE